MCKLKKERLKRGYSSEKSDSSTYIRLTLNKLRSFVKSLKLNTNSLRCNRQAVAAGALAITRRGNRMITIITYGTFDLLHVGHINLLRRARALGDQLIVGLSTDEFNQKMKNKTSIAPYHDREMVLQSLRFVDMVIPETGWDQKPLDIQKYGVKKFVMGDDWQGHFDQLKEYCEVVYLARTENISTTHIKKLVQSMASGKVAQPHVSA